MNSLLVPERTSGLQPILTDSRMRATLLDRLAMRVGLWLIIRGTRSPDVDGDANQRHLERESRELHYLRLTQFHRPY